MAIICFRDDVVIDYVPAYGGNRQDEVKTVVGVRPLNNDGSLDFLRLLREQMEDVNNDKEREAAAKEVIKKTFVVHVAHVRNMTVFDADGQPAEITTGEDLYRYGSRGLIDELTLAMENSSRLSEGQIKNFSGGSAGQD